MRKHILALLFFGIVSTACADPCEVCWYLLRGHTNFPAWYAERQSLAVKPYRPFTLGIDSQGRMIAATWDTAAIGFAQPSAATLVDPTTNALAVAFIADLRKTKQADMQDNVVKAAVLVILDDRNVTAQWLTDFKAAVAAATSLANLQTRVAALPACPQRTPEQIRAAIKEKLE